MIINSGKAVYYLSHPDLFFLVQPVQLVFSFLLFFFCWGGGGSSSGQTAEQKLPSSQQASGLITKPLTDINKSIRMYVVFRQSHPGLQIGLLLNPHSAVIR